ARHGARSQADGHVRGARDPRSHCWPRRASVSLSRPRQPRQHQPVVSGGRSARSGILGFRRLAVLAVRTHLLPDRLPQPAGRDVELGVVVHDLAARRADHRRSHAGDRLKDAGLGRSRSVAAMAVAIAVAAMIAISMIAVAVPVIIVAPPTMLMAAVMAYH